MKKVIRKNYISDVMVCGVQCPYITATFSTGNGGDEEATSYCEKYKTKLFRDPSDDRPVRTKNCTLSAVEWIYYFDED